MAKITFDSILPMDSGTLPVSGPRRRRSRSTCRRLDKLCCLVAGYFPLFFVYGVTSWALYTEAYSIGYRTMGGFQGACCRTHPSVVGAGWKALMVLG